MYKAVIFDLGRVLVDVNTSKGFFNLFNLNRSNGLDAAIQNLMDNKTFKQYNQGRLSSEEFYQSITKEFNVKIPYDDFAVQWCGVFSPMAGMYELVKQLSEKYPLGLLSDTDPLHWNYIVENYPIVKFFPNPVLSFTCGMSKPDKKIFELAAKSVNTPPKNCVYIDDLPKNTAGAESIGIKAIKFESAQQLKRELIALNVLTAE